MNFHKQLALAAVAAVALFCTVSPADAGFQVTFRVGTSFTTVADGDANDTDGTVGTENDRIAVTGIVVGGYTFNTTLARTNTPGTFKLAFVNDSTAEITGTGAATVEVIVSANDFSAPISPPPLLAVSSMTGELMDPTSEGARAIFSFNSYIDTTNALADDDAGTGIGSATSGTITHPDPGGEALNDSEVFSNSTQPFTLNLVLRAQFLDAGSTDSPNTADLDGNLSVRPVPVPGALVLVLTGMPVLGLGAWLRRRRLLTAK